MGKVGQGDATQSQGPMLPRTSNTPKSPSSCRAHVSGSPSGPCRFRKQQSDALKDMPSAALAAVPPPLVWTATLLALTSVLPPDAQIAGCWLAVLFMMPPDTLRMPATHLTQPADAAACMGVDNMGMLAAYGFGG